VVMSMCAMGINFPSISKIVGLEFGIVLTVCHFIPVIYISQ
jgi:hypothetical protein